jgi:hypothetical protein
MDFWERGVQDGFHVLSAARRVWKRFLLLSELRVGAAAVSGERTRLACWRRRLAGTDFRRRAVSQPGWIAGMTFFVSAKVRFGEDAKTSTRDARAPRNLQRPQREA